MLQAQFGVTLFEDIACMIYDLLDAKRQWLNYLENLKLMQVPVYGTATSTVPPATGKVNPLLICQFRLFQFSSK